VRSPPNFPALNNADGGIYQIISLKNSYLVIRHLIDLHLAVDVDLTDTGKHRSSKRAPFIVPGQVHIDGKRPRPAGACIRDLARSDLGLDDLVEFFALDGQDKIPTG
jgi:hypothetical protein